ncbi:MAG: hypothetical protein O9350_02535 [Microcystis sp. LE19-388.1G]|nr:hypothetical protein [Microcystis sp. LE19-388.1G]
MGKWGVGCDPPNPPDIGGEVGKWGSGVWGGGEVGEQGGGEKQ